MATAAQIAELRRLTDEPTQDPYTDAILSLRIDDEPDLKVLAAVIWREKAARFAGLVDIKEGNSDRKLSQLHKQALDMASGFDAEAVALLVRTRRGTRTRPIERM